MEKYTIKNNAPIISDRSGWDDKYLVLQYYNSKFAWMQLRCMFAAEARFGLQIELFLKCKYLICFNHFSYRKNSLSVLIAKYP